MLLVQVLQGVMEGVFLFLIASGLTLIFGVSRIVNFAHGSFYMVGAFLTYQVKSGFCWEFSPGLPPSRPVLVVPAGLGIPDRVPS